MNDSLHMLQITVSPLTAIFFLKKNRGIKTVPRAAKTHAAIIIKVSWSDPFPNCNNKPAIKNETITRGVRAYSPTTEAIPDE